MQLIPQITKWVDGLAACGQPPTLSSFNDYHGRFSFTHPHHSFHSSSLHFLHRLWLLWHEAIFQSAAFDGFNTLSINRKLKLQDHFVKTSLPLFIIRAVPLSVIKCWSNNAFWSLVVNVADCWHLLAQNLTTFLHYVANTLWFYLLEMYMSFYCCFWTVFCCWSYVLSFAWSSFFVGFPLHMLKCL